MTTNGTKTTTRRIVAVCATLVALTIVVCATVIGMSDRDVPESLLVALGASIGVLGALVAGVSDGS